MHYSETNSTDPPSESPFIALISCDLNQPNTTLDNDIFTMANNSGAIAALLYSTSSAACLINPAFADPDSFNRVLDIYTTVTVSSARLVSTDSSLTNRFPVDSDNLDCTHHRLIESQWGNVNSSYYWYSSDRLNTSYNQIEPFYTGATDFVGQGFLMATLIANSSAPANSSEPLPPSGPPPGGSPGGGKSPGTSLAM